MAARGLLKALRGFHASPYKFDKVNIRANLGGGEGNQVFGNGLYIAQAEPTMEHYYEMFKRRKPILSLNDKDLEAWSTADVEDKWPEIIEQIPEEQRYAFPPLMASLDIDGLKALDNMSDDEREIFERFVRPGLRIPPPPEAHRYEMEMATDDTKLLDWDEELGDQPGEIMDAVRGRLQPMHDSGAAHRKATLDRGTDFRGRPLKPRDIERLTSVPEMLEEYKGDRVYKMMGIVDDAGNPAKDERQAFQLAADRLQAAGIDGTKYLDQLSRNVTMDGPVKNPTYNYAIWNDDIITILRRYGLPITGAGVATLASMLNQRQMEMA